MLKISEHLWNGIEKYSEEKNCNKIIYHILFYCLKGYLESSTKKYYLYKLVIVKEENNKELSL